MSGWADFLAGYHAANPAITEDLLLPMRGPGPDGTRQPYEWLCEGLLAGAGGGPVGGVGGGAEAFGAEAPGAPSDGLVWDLCCGSAPVADVVGADRYAGVDLSAPELAVGRARRPGVRVELGDALTTDPPARPAAITIAMALMLVPLETALARTASLLDPGAPLQAIVPTRENGAGTGYGRLLELLGQTGSGYRQQLEPTVLVQALQRHGFDLVSDEVAVFRRPVGPGDVDLVLRSFYLRDADGPGPAAAGDWLRERAATPGYELDYPLRRIRAVRAVD